MSEELLRRVAGRVRLMLGRAILQVINDAGLLQAGQVMVREGEVRENVERFQNYGFTSVPHPGAEAIVVAIGGSTDHPVMICVDDRRYRVKGLADGEVAIYTDEEDVIVFKRGRQIEITAGTSLTITTPITHITGDVQIDGDVHVDGRIDADQDVTGEGTSLHNHTHMEQGDGMPTSPPQ